MTVSSRRHNDVCGLFLPSTGLIENSLFVSVLSHKSCHSSMHSLDICGKKRHAVNCHVARCIQQAHVTLTAIMLQHVRPAANATSARRRVHCCRHCHPLQTTNEHFSAIQPYNSPHCESTTVLCYRTKITTYSNAQTERPRDSVRQRRLHVLFSLIMVDLDTLESRRCQLTERVFTRSVLSESSCLHHLLPDKRDTSVIG